MPNNNKYHSFKIYGWLGLLLIAFGEVIVIFQSHSAITWEICRWTTPICWWGYLLFMDALIFKLKGTSLISNKKKEFLLQIVVSIIIWVIFEVYNLYLQNWEYINLHENIVLRYFGYALAFATIMPGIFLTAEFFETVGIFNRFRIANLKLSPRFMYVWLIFGCILLILPLLIEQQIAQYLFIMVWIGFIFLLEPIAHASGAGSLLRDLEQGKLNRILCLLLAGIICGFLWEFWNYWAVTKWVYKVPFTERIKIFEMPLIGFAGFIPFAWEYFVMYSCVKLLIKKERGTDEKENTGHKTTIY
ncbi:MAG: hypothetical protein ABII90_03735 [Bacteroidota bacterium]